MKRTVLLTASGLVVFLVGALVAFARPVEFGWTSSTPLSQESVWSGIVVLDGVGVLGLTAALIGVALTAGAVGFQAGSRGPRRRDDAS